MQIPLKEGIFGTFNLCSLVKHDKRKLFDMMKSDWFHSNFASSDFLMKFKSCDEGKKVK